MPSGLKGTFQLAKNITGTPVYHTVPTQEISFDLEKGDKDITTSGRDNDYKAFEATYRVYNISLSGEIPATTHAQYTGYSQVLEHEASADFSDGITYLFKYFPHGGSFPVYSGKCMLNSCGGNSSATSGEAGFSFTGKTLDRVTYATS